MIHVHEVMFTIQIGRGSNWRTRWSVGGVAGRQFDSSDVRRPPSGWRLEVRHCPAAGQSLGPADTWRQTRWPRPLSLYNQLESNPQQARYTSRHRSVTTACHL